MLVVEVIGTSEKAKEKKQNVELAAYGSGWLELLERSADNEQHHGRLADVRSDLIVDQRIVYLALIFLQ